MSRDWIASASSIALIAGISSVLIVFLARLVGLSNWSNMTTMEQIIFGTQIARVLFVMVLERRPKFNPVYGMILFSLEVFLVPFLAVLGTITGDRSYTILMGNILTTWIGVGSVVLAPYAVYEYFRVLRRGSPLLNIMVIGTLESGGLLLLIEFLSSVRGRLGGPEALGTLFTQAVALRTIQKYAGIGSDYILTLGLVLFYLGLIVYFAVGNLEFGSVTRLTYILLLPILGSLASLVWTTLFQSFSSDILLVFTAPTLLLIITVWVSMHE